MKPAAVNHFYLGLRALSFDKGKLLVIHEGRMDTKCRITKEYPYILEAETLDGKKVYIKKFLFVNHEVEFVKE